MRRFLPAFIPMVLLALAPAHVDADIYKWRDSSGKMVFSDQPPEQRGVAYEIIENRPVQGAGKAKSDAARMKVFRERQRRLLEAMRRDREQRAHEQQLAAQEKLKQEQKCELVRRQVHAFETSGRVYKDNPDGTKTWLEDADRVGVIERHRKFIEEFCL